MAQPFPYTYYACSCRSSPTSVQAGNDRRTSHLTEDEDEEEEDTFDPTNPRSNYQLFPIEHLLYCTDCHELRCPRCVIEEVVCWFCPNCLFEVPSSSVRSDGNRCTRNCYNCPICTSILSISSLEKPAEGLAPPDAEAKQLGGPYFLSCPYCQWSSLDIGIQFEKHFNLTAQLSKIFKKDVPTLRSSLASNPVSPIKTPDQDSIFNRRTSAASITQDSNTAVAQEKSTPSLSHEARFANLQAFYRNQIAELSDTNQPYGAGGTDFSYNSPSSITRLMNLYTSTGAGARSSRRDKPKPARDASTASEGLAVFDPATDLDAIRRLQSTPWSDTASCEQRALQCREHVRYVDDLRPLATLLRTKRSKRCRACRQILARPEQKVSSTRYKIKLLALANIPKLTLRPLRTGLAGLSGSFPMHATTGPRATPEAYVLKPGRPAQLLLTVTNPLFDAVRVHLATPSVTRGRVASRVTMLCPQFDVGASTDVWDAELASATEGPPGKRASQMVGAGLGLGADGGGGAAGGNGQAEAGKVWVKGRNWTSVVVEVVPGSLPAGASGGADGTVSGAGGLGLREDEDVLEIAVFVRIEYETDAAGDEDGDGPGVGAGGAKRKGKVEGEGGGVEGGREKREEAFWTVLGGGRIVP